MSKLDNPSNKPPSPELAGIPDPRAIDLSGKRLLICEEGLVDYNGHYYGWIKAIREINQRAGAEVIIAANEKLNPEIRDELNAHAIFSRNNWSDIYNGRGRFGRISGIVEHNWITYREVSKLLKEIGPVDCVLLPAVRNYHLAAWRQLCRKHMGTRIGRLVMFFLTSQAHYNDDFTDYSFKGSSRLINVLIRSFRKQVESDQVVLCGDSHVTCGEYEKLTRLPFRLFPSPGAALNQTEATNTTAKDADPVFVMLGVSYFEKGIDLLQTAILRHFEQRPKSKAKFIVQWGRETIDLDGNKIEINPRLRNHPNVELIESTLSDIAYQDKFSAASFLVLPYRRHVYFNRISGVAVEAACSGIPMIVTENTWLDWAVNEFGSGVTIKNNDADDLLEKINHCYDHRTELKEQATQRQSVALEYNSSENYLRCQWGTIK